MCLIILLMFFRIPYFFHLGSVLASTVPPQADDVRGLAEEKKMYRGKKKSKIIDETNQEEL